MFKLALFLVVFVAVIEEGYSLNFKSIQCLAKSASCAKDCPKLNSDCFVKCGEVYKKCKQDGKETEKEKEKE
uniref:TCEN protein n=1 Tax=Schmidtea mediterranea TaxID=79327 RepID=B1NTA3_SCHMD|nr:TCEN protein [Schmidtea mediterranea]